MESTSYKKNVFGIMFENGGQLAVSPPLVPSFTTFVFVEKPMWENMETRIQSVEYD